MRDVVELIFNRVEGGLDDRRKEERKEGMEEGRTDGQMIERIK